MRIFSLFVLCLLLAVFASAQESLHSQARYEWESVEDAVLRYNARLAKAGVPILREGSVHQLSKSIDKLDYSHVTKWESKEQLQKAFREIRDSRFLYRYNPSFTRRCSWLYPHDGCFARAALASQNAAKWGYKRPTKIFVFGTLRVETKNSAKGYVTWWYHVAPIVAGEDQYYILDPAIQPERPLLVDEWLATMINDVKSLKGKICNPYTYVPSSPGENADILEDKRALHNQERYLTREWENIVELGRNPQEELGETPPWPK